MENVLKYKDYYAKVEYSVDDHILHGKIEGISDLITFESNSADEIEKEFQEAVDYYLEFCAQNNKEPDKSYKGTFNVRISPEVHKKLAIYAFENDNTLNQVVSNAIESYINPSKNTVDKLYEIKESIEKMQYNNYGVGKAINFASYSTARPFISLRR